MTLHTEPNGWKFVHETFFQTKTELLEQMKNNPDVQWSVEYQGYYIRPESATHTMLILADAWPKVVYPGSGLASVLGVPRDHWRKGSK